MPKIPSWALEIKWNVDVTYVAFTNRWQWSATGQEYNRDTRDRWPELHNLAGDDFDTRDKAIQDAHEKLKLHTAAIRSKRERAEALQDIQFEVVY